MVDRTSCHVITGNLTQDGSVVYLNAQGAWAATLAQAHCFSDKNAAEQRLAEVAAEEAVITEPYLFEADCSGDQIRALSAREILRAGGPSTRIRRPDSKEAQAP